MFDRTAYFDQVRRTLFDGALNQTQVDGQNAILTCWELQHRSDDLRWLGYMLATTYWETAQTMWPIEEIGKGEGRPYGEPDPETGQTYYGRGFVQLTWKDNYQKATDLLELEDNWDLVWHPEQALVLRAAAQIMFHGMADGWFTGKALGDYFSETTDDPINARQIVNGNDHDEEIADIHDQFMAALVASWQQQAPVQIPEVTITTTGQVRFAINGQIIVT